MTTETPKWRKYIDGLSDAQRHHILIKVIKNQLRLGCDAEVRFREQQTADDFPADWDMSHEKIDPYLYWNSSGDDLLDDFPSERTIEQIIESPQKGDTITLVEPVTDMGEPSFDHESMLRVLGVADEHVWYKEYGIVGRTFKPLKQWRSRIRSANSASVYKHKVE